MSRRVTGFSDCLINLALIRAISSECVYLSNHQSMSIKVYFHMSSKRAETSTLLDCHPTKSLQCRWYHESKGRHNLLLGPRSPNWRKTHQHEILPHRTRSPMDDPRLPMVCCHATKINWAKGWIDYAQLPIVIKTKNAHKSTFVS